MAGLDVGWREPWKILEGGGLCLGMGFVGAGQEGGVAQTEAPVPTSEGSALVRD